MSLPGYASTSLAPPQDAIQASVDEIRNAVVQQSEMILQLTRARENPTASRADFQRVEMAVRSFEMALRSLIQVRRTRSRSRGAAPVGAPLTSSAAPPVAVWSGCTPATWRARAPWGRPPAPPS